MKKVLILTASTGQGHNKAAESLSNTFIKNGYIVEQVDFLYKNSKFLNNTIVGGYEIFAKVLPKTYGVFYSLTNYRKMNSLLSVPFYKTSRKLLSLIKQSKPDIIVGTHALSVNMIGGLKKKGLIKTPFISVVTDFKAHSTYLSQNVDAYITGSNLTKENLSSKGIDINKIYTFGIPIREEFLHKNDELSLTEESSYFNILLMSGSMGLSNISLVLKELIKNKNKLNITIVCGNNKTLKDSLDRTYSKTSDKKVNILGFTNDISSLMDKSHVIISKPGGLTSTESIVKNLPMIIPFAIPGQETENIEVLTELGCAMYVNNLKNLNKIIDDLINNPNKLSIMRNKLKLISSNYSLNGIVKISDELIKKSIVK